MSKENLKDTMGSLFDGMEGFLTSKTVVGEPIYIKDTIILPLVDVSFGMEQELSLVIRRTRAVVELEER